MLKNRNVIFTLAVLLLTSCSQLQTRRSEPSSGKSSKSDSATSKQNESRDDFSGGEDGTGSPSEPPPILQAQDEKKVAVILGPGGYKTFAHVGALKELRKNNIPVHKIVGIEWGSLVAALYAQRGQINEVEWKLYKLEKVGLNNKGFFSNRVEAKSVGQLADYFKENLDSKSGLETKVPFFCPSLSLLRGAIEWQERLPLNQSINYCLPLPPLFKAHKGYVAGMFSYSDITQRLKTEGYNVIILINVLGDGSLLVNPSLKEDENLAVLWNEARRELWRARNSVSDVIEVTTKGIHLSDFESRKLLVTAGEAAGEKAARRLIEKYGF